MLDKIEENVSDEQKAEQKNLNVSLGMTKRKETKVFWSEIVSSKFKLEVRQNVL